MRQTVVGVFDSDAQAQRAAQSLAATGIDPACVHVTHEDRVASGTATGSQARDDSGLMGRVRHFFSDLFGSDDEREVGHYAEAVRRGAAVVKVDVEDGLRLDRVRDALQDAGAVDIDERMASWRAEGWSDEYGSATGLGTGQGDAASGRVRVYPRPTAGSTIGAATTGSAMGGAETLGSSSALGAPSRDFDEAYYRQDWQTRFGNEGGRYEDYEPAYRYGHSLAGDPRYGGRDWDDLESDVRADWAQRHPGTGGTWDRMKAAVRHAWERAKH